MGVIGLRCIRHLLMGVLCFYLAGCTGVPDGIEPVTGFDQNRYLGTWYEIARLPQRFDQRRFRYDLEPLGTGAPASPDYEEAPSLEIYRPCDTDSTSRSAAEPRPVINPMRRGRKGRGRFRRASKSPSAARATRNRSMRASSSPTPTGRHCVAHREKEPRPA